MFSLDGRLLKSPAATIGVPPKTIYQRLAQWALLWGKLKSCALTEAEMEFLRAMQYEPPTPLQVEILYVIEDWLFTHSMFARATRPRERLNLW